MRSLAVFILALPLALAACAVTPRQQCEAPYRAELRNVDVDLRETRLILRRGYNLVPARDTFGLKYCLRPTGTAYPCQPEEGEAVYDKRPINRRAEQAKLDALHSEAVRLTRAIAACQAQYPE
jgi:hypothetical protein